MVTIKAPVSLMLAGEWANREDGNSCLASAINKSIVITIEVADKIVVNAASLGIVASSLMQLHEQSKEDSAQSNVKALVNRAIFITQSYLKGLLIPLKLFSLTINTDSISITHKNGEVHRVDLNINASLAVGIVKALLHLHGQNVTTVSGKQHVFKLAFITLYGLHRMGEYGPGVAASAYATTVIYQHVSFSWLAKQLQQGDEKIQTIVDKSWPDLKITAVGMPDDLKLCVCFVENQPPTYDYAEKIDTYKAAYPIRYKQLCASINLIVKDLVQAIQNNEKQVMLELIKQNKQLLKHLLEESGNEVHFPALSNLISSAEQCGAAAKFAGTHDTGYGFALCLDRFTAQKVKRKWEKKGMQMLNTQILG